MAGCIQSGQAGRGRSGTYRRRVDEEMSSSVRGSRSHMSTLAGRERARGKVFLRTAGLPACSVRATLTCDWRLLTLRPLQLQGSRAAWSALVGAGTGPCRARGQRTAPGAQASPAHWSAQHSRAAGSCGLASIITHLSPAACTVKKVVNLRQSTGKFVSDLQS